MKWVEINEGHIAHLEKDKRKGFNTIWLVDKDKCPACGSETRYELKPPNFPQVHVCSHVVGMENKSIDPEHPVWVFEYRYQVQRPGKTRERKANPLSANDFGRIIKSHKSYQKALSGQTDLQDFFHEVFSK